MESQSWNGLTENGAMGTRSLSSNEVQKKKKPRIRNKSTFPLVRIRPQSPRLSCEAVCSFDSSISFHFVKGAYLIFKKESQMSVCLWIFRLLGAGFVESNGKKHTLSLENDILL